MSRVLESFKIVFKRKAYVLLTLVVAIAFYMINALMSNFGGIIDFYRKFGFIEGSELFLRIGLGFGKTIELYSHISLIVISLLLGVLISLIVYRIKEISLFGNLKNRNKKIGFFAGVGIFLGILVPGCAACGLGLVSFLGLESAFLAFLPFKGLEVSLLAVLLLVFSVYFTAKDLLKCEISNFNSDKGKLKGGKKQ